MKDEALLPCPFCGKHSAVEDAAGVDDDVNLWVVCEACGASGPIVQQPALAISAWNRRAAPEHPEAGAGVVAANIDEFALQVARDIWNIGNKITAGESQRKAQIQVRVIEALRQWQPAPATSQHKWIDPFPAAVWADSEPDHGEGV